MANTILFAQDKKDPLVHKILLTAKSQGWALTAGIKQWAKETYNATLRSGRHGNWTSITFKTEQDMTRFKNEFGVDL